MPRHIILKYTADHPAEVLAAVEDKTDALVRELERHEQDAMRELRRSPRRYIPEQGAELPF